MKRKLYSNVIENKKAIDEEKKEIEKAKKDFKLDNEPRVVILKEDNGTRLLKLISYKFEGLMKVFFWLFMMGIVSVGATVLLNPSLREQFLSIFK
ncbi:MAG: hypothetical protein RR585_11320 [Coprobacillus sp.]